MTARLYLIGCIIIFSIGLSFSIYRDIQFDKQYPDDLRNRVVGARLIKDGRSPYFYKWKKEDGLRYYDPKSFDSYKVSNITASPFFHHLMYPLVEMPQRQISKWWLLIEYCMFFTSVLLAFKIANTKEQRLLVLISSALFLFTEGWKVHIFGGQNYLCIPFLAFLFYNFISKKQSLLAALIAGCCSIAMVLIHVNTIFFFIPFLWRGKNYSKAFIISFILPIILACAFIFFNKQERSLWTDYNKHIAEQVKLHQNTSPAIQVNEADPKFENWEGINKSEIEQYHASYPIHLISENGNFFYIIKILFHKKIPVLWLIILAVGGIIFFVCLFAIFHKKNENITLPEMGLMGFSLYMMSEFFSPIYRWQYYSVQWLFPLLIACAAYKQFQKWIFFLLGTGLILNIINDGLITMEHTMGEYCMLLAFLMLALGNSIKWQSKLDKLNV